MSNIISIEFGPKFTQSNMNEMLLIHSFECSSINYKNTCFWDLSMSPSTKEVIFDLSITEWVNNEQITFLFAWIRNIKHIGKKVIVKLPYRNHLTKYGYFDKDKMAYLERKYIDSDGIPYSESEYRIQRRKDRNAILLSIWGMLNIGLSQFEFENMADSTTVNVEDFRLKQNINQIIPFTSLKFNPENREVKFESQFYDAINKNFEVLEKTNGVFDIEESIQNLLKEYSCYSPFESKILSNVITQELYINSLQHSFEKEIHANSLKECYLSAFLSNKWPNENSKYFVPSFEEEKYKYTLDFYKDKIKISSIINKYLKTKSKNITENERDADLSSYKYYRNISFLEYTFLDFGNGIFNSLQTYFEEEIKKENFHDQYELSKNFDKANFHSKIIEFALLLETSKNPLDKTIDNYNLVPRGLFFLIDMIRRFKGLLIVRSGNGKVIYDFSDKILLRKNENETKAVITESYRIKNSVIHIIDEDIPFFPGTMYSIVLPEKSQININKQNVLPAVKAESDKLEHYARYLKNKSFFIDPNEEFYPTSFQYISILFLYNDAIENFKKDKKTTNIKDVYNKLFKAINDELDKYKSSNCIVFFDFAGLKSGNISWLKIIYFLLITPKINESTKAVIVNLPSDESKIVSFIKKQIIGNETDSKESKNQFEPFLLKPIPCIKFDLHEPEEKKNLIDWIGLKEPEDESVLTNMLLKIKDNYPINRINNPDNLEGSLVLKDDDNITLSFSGFDTLQKEYLKVQKNEVTNYLKKYIVDGFNTEKNENEFVFLTSNGGYQFKYLTIFELLHDKYVARYFAKSLLDQYTFFVQSQKNIENDFDISNYRFNKIITVTVSSQLIGVAIRDLIEQDDSYKFLRLDNPKNSTDLAPELILLSSYYSFDTEKPFEKIEETDTVIIVNDVISTGNLVKQLYTKLDTVKKVPVRAILSITDARIPIDKINVQKELASVEIEEMKDFFFSLSTYNDGIDIHIFKGPYTGNAKTKRINPLLNTIVELSVEHSEPNKILFPDVKDFILSKNFDSKYLKIGHFQQGISHNGYLTDLRGLFSSSNGHDILLESFTIANERIQELSSNSIIEFVKNQIFRFSEKNKLSQSINESFLRIEAELEIIKKEILELNNSSKVKERLSPDFIFYPIFSGIEKVPHNKISRIFNTHVDNIVGLQRFDTPKGWRFPFPPKRLNYPVKNKEILILDTGSLTGDSLIQLVDNLTFLEIDKIIVISLVTRIEDYFREFYSRLKVIKVKRLKSGYHFSESNIKVDEKIIPIDIYFGISLHIPVYSSSVACPFCIEKQRLENIESSHFPTPPNHIKSYIDKRLLEIKEMSAKENSKNAGYFPIIKGSRKDIDTKNIFIMRDTIGKIENYRFYPECFTFFEELIQSINQNDINFDTSKTKKEIELILCCVLHEHDLFNLFKNLLNELNELIKKYLIKMLDSWDNLFETHYTWSKVSVYKLHFTFFKEQIFSLNIFPKMLFLADDESEEFLQFVFWDILYCKNRSFDSKTKIEDCINGFEFSDTKSQEYNEIVLLKLKKLKKILANSYKLIRLRDEDNLSLPFYNLYRFFLKGESRGRHFELKGQLNKLIASLSYKNPKTSIIKQDLKNIADLLNDELKPNINRILRDKNLSTYYPSLYSKLDESDGIMKYINFFIKSSLEVNKLKDSDELFPQRIDDLTSNSLIFINEVLNEDSEDTTFFDFCNQYPCKLKKVLSKYEERENVIITYNFSSNAEIFLIFNEVIFDTIIAELIENAQNHTDNAQLKFEISKNDKTDTVLIRFQQNKLFKPSTKKGGLTNNVKHYVEQFGGSYADNSEDNAPDKNNFEISLNLRKHKYEN